MYTICLAPFWHFLLGSYSFWPYLICLLISWLQDTMFFVQNSPDLSPAWGPLANSNFEVISEGTFEARVIHWLWSSFPRRPGQDPPAPNKNFLDRRQSKTLKLNQVGILSFIFTQTLTFSTWLAVYTTSHISRIQCRIHRSHGGTSP
jgi:hypothetical protein